MEKQLRLSNTMDSQVYSASQIKSVLKSIGVDIIAETGNDFLCLCPFHGNRNTPSFSVSKERGAFICFNPSCGESGSIIDIVKRLTERNEFEAIRFIKVKEIENDVDFEDTLSSVLEDKPDFVEFSQETLDRLHADLAGNKEARDYFESRGINEESMKHFALGYSSAMNMVITPVHSPDGMPVGLVGRSISEKRFKNSNGLPKNKTMFNLHRAKKLGGIVIVVESNFDAIRVHQAGFPNVVATLGGHISNDNINLLNKYFTKIIIMTDSDEAGRSLGKNIASKLRNKEVLWAMYDDEILYPHGAKDVGDMNDAEIKQCISNAIPHFQYSNNML
jgi:DNA primase